VAKEKNYIEIAYKYAEDICNKKILACKWTILACQRFLDDIERSSEDWPFTLSDKANTFCRAIEMMPHVKGRDWVGQKISLEPWQCFLVVNVFGWVHKETGLRRFRTVYIEVPRKNAKSTLTSTVGICMLALDGEPGAEIYSAATTRDQAKIVFEDAQNMVRRMPTFRAKYGAQVNARNINILKTASKFEALSAEGSTLDGLNIHFAGVDELHAHKTRNVFDVLETATGARAQPLLWLITTAGSNQAGICYEQRSYLTKILEDVTDDDTYFGIIYTIDDTDEWTDPEIWKKANPNYGVSVYPDDIARLCKKATQMPSAQNNFLTKRLNVWVNADEAWMEMRAWAKCADPNLSIERFKGKKCWVAVDLASKIDIAAMVQLFVEDEHYYVFCHFYLPEEALENPTNSQYSGWVRSGRLIETPGVMTDFSYIEDDLKQLKNEFEIIEVPYDPFQATQFSTRMAAEGFPMVEVGATVKNFSEPMKELEAIVLDGRFHFDGDPVLSWMVSNVVCHRDKKDNIYPNKERPENKIDGVVAILMALNREIRHRNDGSVYEERSSEIDKLRAELSRLHNLPRGTDREEKEIQAKMDDISKQIDDMEENFITTMGGL
jgi:phage terminase large subunit-like protein